MIISDEKKFVFLHINMTGGTTVDQALKPFYDHWPSLAKKLDYRGEQHPYQGTVTRPWDASRKLYLDCCRYDELVRISREYVDIVKDYFTFTFVRNPYDRQYSFWRKECAQGRTSVPFQDFRKTRPPQIDHLPSLDQLNWIGTTDYFARDIEKLRVLIDIPESVEFTPKNVSSPITEGYRYIENFSEGDIDFVNTAYEGDFNAFGFKQLQPEIVKRLARS